MSQLEGLDVSHWQSGLRLAGTGEDFAIFKATDGTSYVDTTCDGFVSQAKSAGMKWGVYHFAENTGNMTAEADHFVAQTKGYVGDGLLVLDWEHGNLGNVSGAKAFADRVFAKTGVRPLIYMSQSTAANYNWDSVQRDYALWVARYNESIGSTGGWPVTMWQYTSSGHVSGWSGLVDKDHFYGSEATWDAFASGGQAPAPSPDPDPDGDDDMPTWKNIQYTDDWDVVADGEWHTLRTDTSDDGKDTYYSVLNAEAYVTGTLHVTLTGLAKGHEVDLRTVLIDAKSGEPVKVAVQGSVKESFAGSGNTQLELPFTVHVNDGPSGWTRKLRFQIRPYGGETITVTGTHTRMLYWEK